MTTPDPTLAARLADPNAIHINMLNGRIAKPSVTQIVHIYAGQLITTAEADARVKAAVLAEREACALWHDREASAVMNGLHCGSENSDYRAANRLHDFHAASATAVRARGVTG